MNSNWTLIIVAIIAALPPSIISLIGLKKTDNTSKSIQEVHLSLNSRLDALLKAEKKISKAEGVKEGKDIVK